MLSNFSIKYKIIVIIVFIATISGFIGNIINYLYEVNNSKKQLINNTILQAKLISESCWLPLEFNYPKEAESLLKQLHTNPAILDCILFSANDSVFSSYHKSSDHVEKIPSTLKSKNYIIEGNYLHVKQSVASKDVNYGYLYIRSQIDWEDIINRRLKVVLLIIGFSLSMVIILAYFMQKSISRPIVKLTNQMNKVAESNDYSVQFQYNAIDEIGKLYQGFNYMMSEINQAEMDLKKTFQSLKDSEIKWQFAIEGTGDGLWDWNIEANEVFITSNWKSMLGYNDDDIDNNAINWEKFIHPSDYLNSLRKLEKHFTGQTEIYLNEYRLLCKNGTYKWVLARGKVIEWSNEKKARRFIGTHSDITNRKNAEEELRQHRDELEKLVEVRTTELKNATSIAEKANMAKSSFLANMSHEIRTPMNAIIGYSSILIELNALDEKESEYLKAINRSGHHLLSIINDILDISKIEAGKIEIYANDFNIQLLINDLRRIFELKAIEKSLDFNIIVDPNIPNTIKADENKIRQILTNLLGNAFKFTNTGKIQLTLELQSKDDNYLIASVTDTGSGISEDYLDKIFEPFERGISYSSIEGTGLGLAIARKFARIMMGDITVKSVPGQGSTFLLIFPFEKVLVNDVFNITNDNMLSNSFEIDVKAENLYKNKILEAFALISEEIKLKMQHAASIGYRKELIEIVGQINETNQELADYLMSLVKKMKFNEIINLTSLDANKKL